MVETGNQPIKTWWLDFRGTLGSNTTISLYLRLNAAVIGFQKKPGSWIKPHVKGWTCWKTLGSWTLILNIGARCPLTFCLVEILTFRFHLSCLGLGIPAGGSSNYLGRSLPFWWCLILCDPNELHSRSGGRSPSGEMFIRNLVEGALCSSRCRLWESLTEIKIFIQFLCLAAYRTPQPLGDEEYNLID